MHIHSLSKNKLHSTCKGINICGETYHKSPCFFVYNIQTISSSFKELSMPVDYCKLFLHSKNIQPCYELRTAN